MNPYHWFTSTIADELFIPVVIAELLFAEMSVDSRRATEVGQWIFVDNLVE